MSTSGISGLSSYFTSIINNLMTLEAQPYYRMQEQRDTINVRKAVYDDVEDQLKSLKSAVKDLTSTSNSSLLTSGRTVAVSDVPTGYSVLSASASSSAVTGTYNVSVSTLAKQHRVRSDQQTYSDQALNLSGTILLGGAADRSIENPVTLNSTVTGFSTGDLDDDQTELGSSNYFVETRNDATAGWQFRLVDAEGNAVSVQTGSTGNYSSDWQSISAGEYDTGRGMKITFGSDGYEASSRDSTPAAANITYNAKGASIDISASDSLVSIATKINNADYGDGNGVVATIVDRQLILSAAATGANSKVLASGSVLESLGILGADSQSGAEDIGAADGFKHTLQEGSNASFSVNGVNITRSKNSNLTDVIAGVNLNLAADAATRSATLNVTSNWTTTRGYLDTFITQFNKVQSYLDEKTAITKSTEGESTTYTRGALADDNVFSELRGNLFSKFISQYQNSGAYKSLREIGITISDSLQASVSDADALEEALNSDLEGVKELLSTVMSSMETELTRFTGTSTQDGYIDNAQSGMSNQITDLNNNMSSYETYLSEREAFLTQQYAEMQSQLLLLTYSQSTLSSMYGSYNTSG